MDFQEFCNQVKDRILDYLPEEYAGGEVVVDGTLKNNGLVKQGISILTASTSIVPKLYLEEFYNHYQDGTPFEELCEDIARVYQNSELKELPFPINRIVDYESQKPFITMKVLSAKENQELLKTRPSMKLDDMVVVYQIDMGTIQGDKATVGITDDIMKHWNVSVEELHKVALENTERLSPARLFTFESFVLHEKQNFLLNPEEYTPGYDSFLVLSNQDLNNGAAIVANPEVLRRVSEVVNDSFYILPSSVHEVLIMPKKLMLHTMTAADMGEMVREINETQVASDERLSNHIYEYDKENHLFKTVEESKEVSMQETPEKPFANFKPVTGRSAQQQTKRPPLSI